MEAVTYIEFILNGEKVRLDFEQEGLKPSTTVLHYLRSRGIMAPKEVCGEGDCGACSIVLGSPGEDGKMHYKTLNSCMLFLPFLQGKELITTEYLDRGQLHPVQESLVKNHAIQCGYCTSGFAMSLFSLYKEVPVIDREVLDLSLSGNLCRCTGYRSIYKAGMELNKYGKEDVFAKEEKQTLERLQLLENRALHLEAGNQLYMKPRTLAAALALRKAYPEASLVAGGSDLTLLQNKQDVEFRQILDLSALEELKYFRETETEVVWGAMLSVEEVFQKIPFPEWKYLLARFASKQIRNIATFSGNIANASPIGDTIPLLFAFGAKLRIASAEGERELRVEDFITGYRQTGLRDDELIIAVILPKYDANTHIRSYKISRRTHVDISTLSAAFRMQIVEGKITEAVLAYGGMAAMVKRAGKAETFLLGKPFTGETIRQAMPLVKEEFTPLSDARASAGYRNEVAANLLLQYWNDLSV